MPVRPAGWQRSRCTTAWRASWRHLDFFEYEVHLHAEVPRVGCTGCGKVTQIPVPWAREGSHFTLLFEALTLMLAPTMSVLAAGRVLRVRSPRLWRVIEHHVAQARAKESHAKVRAVGVDETASKRGQTYITVFHDLDAPRLLFATPGRDKATLRAPKGARLDLSAASLKA